MVQPNLTHDLLIKAATAGGEEIISELEAMLRDEAPSLDDPRWRQAVAAARHYIDRVLWAAVVDERSDAG